MDMVDERGKRYSGPTIPRGSKMNLTGEERQSVACVRTARSVGSFVLRYARTISASDEVPAGYISIK